MRTKRDSKRDNSKLKWNTKECLNTPKESRKAKIEDKEKQIENKYQNDGPKFNHINTIKLNDLNTPNKRQSI